MRRKGDGEPTAEEAYARGGRVAQRKYGAAPAPRMSGTKFPEMKVGPAPRPRAAPRMPAAEEAPAALQPSRVFPVRSRSAVDGAAARGNDAVPVGDGYSMAEDEV